MENRKIGISKKSGEFVTQKNIGVLKISRKTQKTVRSEKMFEAENLKSKTENQFQCMTANRGLTSRGQNFGKTRNKKTGKKGNRKNRNTEISGK